MTTLRMGRDEAAASQVLQQRIEQLRIANWQRLSDPVWVGNNILNQNADGSDGLTSIQETVTVAPYNSASTASNIYSRSNGTATSNGGNTSLITEKSLKVTWQVTWTGLPNNRTHTRQTTAIFGQGGVAKY